MTASAPDILIIGGGLSGLTLAGVLGRAGVRVTVIDRDAPAAQQTEQYDARATALSWATHCVLRAAGVWEGQVAPLAEPMLDIRVADGGSPFFLHFSADGSGTGAPFGWNIENLRLRKALHRNVASLKDTVEHLAPVEIKKFFRADSRVGVVLKDGRKISAPLMVGADGRQSAVRQWLGLGVTVKDYAQTAIVCTIAHEKDHENVAVEHFLPGGPFALIPLTKDARGAFRSSVIWTVPADEAPDILALPAADFDAEMQRLCGPHLGRVRQVCAPRGYPLALQQAESYVGPRVALVAEAAHVVHPIAGQGLNLGMRDVALLSELASDRLRLGLDPGMDSLLKEYENIRQADTRLMAGFTGALNGLFSNDLAGVAALRGLGLGFVQKMPVLKRFFARQAMGLGGIPARMIRQEGR